MALSVNPFATSHLLSVGPAKLVLRRCPIRRGGPGPVPGPLSCPLAVGGQPKLPFIFILANPSATASSVGSGRGVGSEELVTFLGLPEGLGKGLRPVLG